MANDKKAINIALDLTTWEAMNAVADAEGVTIAALVEAFGRAIASDQKPPMLPRFVAEARAVMSERRRR